MNRKPLIMLVGACAVLFASATATAQQGPRAAPIPYVPQATPTPSLQEDYDDDIGIGLTLGGGGFGFTNDEVNDLVDPGPGWEARAIFGTDTLLAGELAYTGSVSTIETFAGEPDSELVSNGAEAALRINLLQDEIMPFVIAGAGWRNYEVTDTSKGTSSLQNDDNVFEFPVGGGLAFNYGRFLADVRATWRPTVEQDLIRFDDDDDALNAWRAAANIGYEF